jgi:hypothetical protein
MAARQYSRRAPAEQLTILLTSTPVSLPAAQGRRCRVALSELTLAVDYLATSDVDPQP